LDAPIWATTEVLQLCNTAVFQETRARPPCTRARTPCTHPRAATRRARSGATTTFRVLTSRGNTDFQQVLFGGSQSMYVRPLPLSNHPALRKMTPFCHF
jgi:hypothetical protein